MIESATLPAAERRQREIDRLRRDAGNHPGETELQLHFANLLLEDGRTGEAVAAFGELLNRNGNSRVWEQAGGALLRSGQYDLARIFLERAAPDRPAARLDLATALFFTEGPAKALEQIDHMPDGVQPGDRLLLKARLLDASGREAEAASVLQEGLRHSTSRPQVAQEAALLLVRRDRKSEALELLKRSIASAPDNADLRLTRAIVLGLMQQPAAALAEIKQIEARWPEWDRPYLAEGLLLESSSRRGLAKQKVQTAIALGAQDPAAHCALARLTKGSAADAECACRQGLDSLLFPKPSC